MLKKIFQIFRPAAFLPEISDPAKVSSLYHYWRIRILYSMFIGYAFYYLTRMSFTFAMPGIVLDLGLDKGQLGLLGSIFSITYGISKFASGILSDRANARYFMAVGLVLTGILNILFGLSSSIFFFSLFWGLNGWFQGFGWPPCARFLTHWYSQSERGSWWSTWNISHNIGAFIAPWIAGICLQYFGWRYAMYIPGVLCLFGGVFLVNRLRDTPQSLGLPTIEKFRNDYGTTEGTLENDKELSFKEIFVEYILKNPYIWMLSFASFFLYVVRVGINTWSAFYLIEAKGYSGIGASGCVSLFEVGGLFGSLTAGWASDYFFGSKRGPINALFSIGIFASLFLFWAIPLDWPLLDSLSLFLIGFFVFGPQMMIGVAAAELSHKKAASTSTGFAGCFAYVGGAFAGYPIGKIVQDFGWEGFFLMMTVCCLICLVILVPMWNVTRRTEKLVKTPLLNDEEDANASPECLV